ncbi:hypothetical protein DSM104299_02638 [Baekduia alba]|nr:hypothetical protein DSM104299_02638 [Baekduia alba]
MSQLGGRGHAPGASCRDGQTASGPPIGGPRRVTKGASPDARRLAKRHFHPRRAPPFRAAVETWCARRAPPGRTLLRSQRARRFASGETCCAGRPPRAARRSAAPSAAPAAGSRQAGTCRRARQVGHDRPGVAGSHHLLGAPVRARRLRAPTSRRAPSQLRREASGAIRAIDARAAPRRSSPGRSPSDGAAGGGVSRSGSGRSARCGSRGSRRRRGRRRCRPPPAGRCGWRRGLRPSLRGPRRASWPRRRGEQAR